MDERELVLQFVANMKRLTKQVGQEMAAQTGGSHIGALLSAVNQRRVSRKWQLVSGTYYAVHGVGCYIKDSAGTVIDVDVASDGRTLLFEAGRIQQFAESVRALGYTIDQIKSILRQLVQEHVLIVVNEVGHQGWFAAADAE